MRPIPLPDGWTEAHFGGVEHVRKVIAPPGGDLTDPTCGPIEAVVTMSLALGSPRPQFSMLWTPETDDERDTLLRADGLVQVTMIGGVLPHELRVTRR